MLRLPCLAAGEFLFLTKPSPPQYRDAYFLLLPIAKITRVFIPTLCATLDISDQPEKETVFRDMGECDLAGAFGNSEKVGN
jgi:hypothetical protein